MTKIAIFNYSSNRFPISDKGIYKMGRTMKFIDQYYFTDLNNEAPKLHRDDPTLIALIEEMKSEFCSKGTQVKIVSVPDDVDWYISGYDDDVEVEYAGTINESVQIKPIKPRVLNTWGSNHTTIMK